MRQELQNTNLGERYFWINFLISELHDRHARLRTRPVRLLIISLRAEIRVSDSGMKISRNKNTKHQKLQRNK